MPNNESALDNKNAKLRITPGNMRPYRTKCIECGCEPQLADARTESLRKLFLKKLSQDPNLKSSEGYKLGECCVDPTRGFFWFMGYDWYPKEDGLQKIENWQGVRYPKRDEQ